MTFSHYDLVGRKVVVTGGAGFIGSHLVDLLVDAGCGEIVVIDDMVRGRPENLAAAQSRGPVRLIVDDIRNLRLLEETIRNADTVFHMAALRITHCAAEPRLAMEVMVDATFETAEICRRYGIRKLVMPSSASVYGMASEFPTPETQHPYANRTLYGVAKTFSEGLLRVFHDAYGLDYVSLRYFNVYGPRLDIHGRYTEVLVRWMERIEAGLAPIVFGDGSQTMDMIHVRDVARATLLAATAPVSDRVFNIGSGGETSLAELARLLAQTMGRTTLEPLREKERAVNPVPRRLADIGAARDGLGFTAAISLAEGLQDTVDWWRSQKPATEAPP